MSSDPWIGAVMCPHRAMLARTSTVASWTSESCCGDTSTAVEGWQVGVQAATATAATMVRDAVAALAPLGQPVSATLARVSREALPSCSILLSDGVSVGALSWGRLLGLVGIDRWEYALSSQPVVGRTWSPISNGTLIDLADCGPTAFLFPYSSPAKESA